MGSFSFVLRHHVLFALCFLGLMYSAAGFQFSLRPIYLVHVSGQRSLVVRPQTMNVLWSTVPSQAEFNNNREDQTTNISNTFQSTNSTSSLTEMSGNKSIKNSFKNGRDTFFAYLISRLLFFQKIRNTIMKTVTGKSSVKPDGNNTSSKRLWNRPSTGPGNNPNNKKNLITKFASLLRYFFFSKAGLLRLTMLVIATVFYQKFIFRPTQLVTEISFSNFLKLLSEKPELFSRVRASPNSLTFMIDGKSFFTRVVNLPIPILEKLITSGVNFHAPAPPKNIFGMLSSLLYLGFMWRLVNRMMQGPADEGVGKGRGDLDLERYGDLSFDDIAGQDQAKGEVKEITDMLRDPDRYYSVGARLPSGVLLVGPPGSGKTLLARVTAAEARVPFYSCSASDFVEVFVGRGPARVRKLFEKAALTAPSIIFIDEIDSIGRSRRMGSMNSEQESTLNQILTCMDGLDTSNNGVIVMAATNRLELLDSALLRAGRFDRIVQCPLPDKNGRLEILKVYTRKLRLDPMVDLDKVARVTVGLSGADLSTIVNEASIRTARRGGNVLITEDFADALRSFMSGRSMSLGGLTEMATQTVPDMIKKAIGLGNENSNNNGREMLPNNAA